MNHFFRPSLFDGRPVLDVKKLITAIAQALLCLCYAKARLWLGSNLRQPLGFIKVLLWIELAILTGLMVGVVVWRVWIHCGGAS